MIWTIVVPIVLTALIFWFAAKKIGEYSKAGGEATSAGNYAVIIPIIGYVTATAISFFVWMIWLAVFAMTNVVAVG